MQTKGTYRELAECEECYTMEEHIEHIERREHRTVDIMTTLSMIHLDNAVQPPTGLPLAATMR
jgi:hypothetical protein